MTTAKRVALLPDVPTLEEAGYPGQEGDTPQCVLVPAGISRAIVDLVHREILRIIALPDVKEKFAAIGFEPIGTTPEEFAARIKVDVPDGRRSSASPTPRWTDAPFTWRCGRAGAGEICEFGDPLR